jgi:hypothetical protein
MLFVSPRRRSGEGKLCPRHVAGYHLLILIDSVEFDVTHVVILIDVETVIDVREDEPSLIAVVGTSSGQSPYSISETGVMKEVKVVARFHDGGPENAASHNLIAHPINGRTESTELMLV